MAIIPIEQLSDEQASKVVPLDQLPQGEAPKSINTKKIFRDSLKQTARNMMGTGMSEFIPGLESPSIEAADKSAMSVGKNVANKLSIPNSPNLPIKFAGLQGNINPNTVAATAIGGLLTPQALAGVPGGALEQSAMNAARPGMIMRSSRNALKEAEKLTTQILQPTTTELSEAILKGQQLPSIKRGAESIVASKSFEDVVKSLKTTTKDLFDERNMILDHHNTPIGDEPLKELSSLAGQAAKEHVLNPRKLKQFDEVFYREAKFLEDNPNLNIIQAQQRKEALQKLTRPLLEKRAAGTLTGNEQVELQAYDALRSGYRKAILKALPKDKAVVVDKINSKYEGLLDATELASAQAAKSIKEVPKSLLEKVAASFGLSPQYTAFRLATKEVAGVVGKTRLERTTGKIAELRTKSETLNQLARLARRVKT